MKLHAYLGRSRHGIFYFRWPLPRTNPKAPRRSVRVSLSTRCPREAGTFARHLAVCGEAIQQHIRMSSMNHAELRDAVKDYFREALEKAKDRRSSLGPFTDGEKERLGVTLGLLEEGNSVYWRTMGRDHAREELDKFFQASGLPREEFSGRNPQVLDEIRRASIGFFQAILHHGQSLERYDFTEALNASLSASEDQFRTEPRATLGGAVRAFLDEHEKVNAWTEGTLQKRRAALDVALDWFGAETEIAGIGKREAAEFKTALLSLPSNRTKSTRLQGLSLREAVAVEGVPKMSSATVNSYLSAYKLFWEWAEAHGYTSEVLFDGMTVPKKTGAVKDRKPFYQEALDKTYKALTDPGSKFYRKTSHRWATLIAMFSGARLNEVCQLQIGDIIQDGGIWALDFTEEGDTNKRLKSVAARRRVPIHSHLIELGLLDYHADMKASDQVRLFPDYSYSPKHGYGDKLSKWFNRTFTQNLGIKSDAHVFHGLRHTFVTRLGQVNVPIEHIQFVVGHERQGVTQQVYFKQGYTLKQAREAVESFSL